MKSFSPYFRGLHEPPKFAISKFHVQPNMASCVLGRPKAFGHPKTNLPPSFGAGGGFFSKVEKSADLIMNQSSKKSPNMESRNPKTQKRNTGRKPEKDPAIFRYGFKLTSEENVKFEELFLKSGMKHRARFIKNLLFGREMKVVKIDKATMDYYIRLTNFYTQFQAIGNNYNQTVKAIKTNFSEKRALALMYKLEKITIQLIVLSKEIIQLTEDYERKWLQK